MKQGQQSQEGPQCHVKKHGISFLFCLRCDEKSLKGGQANVCYDRTDAGVENVWRGMRARRGGQRGYLFRDPERRRHCRPWREQWRRKLCGQIPNTFWRHFSQDLPLINWTFGVRGKDEPGFEAEHPGWTVVQLTWYILRETPSLQTRLPQFSLLIIISRDPILTLPLLGSLPRFLMSFYNSVTVSAMLWNAGWLFKYETQLFF